MEERDENLILSEEETAEAEETPEENGESGSESEMTVAGWLWRMCIPIIPCAGIIIYIVLLCIWAFGKKETETMRVWAKAALIATAIQLVFFGVIFLVVQLNVDVLGFIRTFLKKIF